MLKIEKKVVEHTGGIEENLIDTAMVLDFMFDELEQEFGHRTAQKILTKTLLKVFKQKKESR